MPEGSATRERWRPHEAARLTARWERAAAGDPVTVVLRGDAGSGKTRLVADLADTVATGGGLVLAGAAVDVGDQLPHHALAGGLRALLASASGSAGASARRARDALEPLAAELPRLLEGSPAGSGEDAAEHQGRLLELVRRVVTALAARAPLLVVVEDLHWADRGTREAVTTLVAALREEPVMLLLTVRSDALTDGHPLRALLSELGRHPRVAPVDLAPLDRTAVARVVAGRAVVPHADDLVWRRSGGNAFIVEETLRALRDGHPDAVSTTLRDLVLGRVAALDADALAVVRAVALGEEPVPHRLLADVAGLAPTALNTALRAARDAAVLVVDPAVEGYGLRHGLMRDVLAAELLPGERHEVHRRYGRALDAAVGVGAGFGDAGTVPLDPAVVLRRAHHWYLADDPERALPAVALAARDAEGRRDYATAHRQWDRALDLAAHRPVLPAAPLPRALPPATTVDLTAGVGGPGLLAHAAEVAHLAGEHDRAVALLRRLLETAPVDDVGVVTRLGRFLLDAGRTHEAVTVLGGTGTLDGRAGASAARRAARAEALLVTGDVRGARDEAERAVALSRVDGERPEQAPMLATLGFALAYLEDPAAGLDAVAHGLRIAERTGDGPAVGRAYGRWADLLVGPLHEIAEGVAVARQGLARMRDLGLARTHGVRLLATAANGLFRLGAWAEAQEAVDEAWAHRPEGADALEIRLARVRLLVGRGEFAAADEDLGAVELLSQGGPESRRVPLLTLRSGLQMWRGRPGEARVLVAAGLDLAERMPDDVFLLAPLVWHGLRAEAEAAARGDRDAAALARLVRHVDDLARRVPGTTPALRRTVDTYVRMCRAEIPRVAGASDPAAWAAIATAWSAQLSPYPAAYAQLRRADALLARRRGPASGEVRRCLEAAAEAGRAMGAGPFLAEVAEVAARAALPVPLGAGSPAGRGAAGAPPHAPAVSGAPAGSRAPELAALTTREFEVLERIAEGLSNREIAKRLGVAERTAASHVSTVLHKTDTRSRTQAAALLQRVRART